MNVGDFDELLIRYLGLGEGFMGEENKNDNKQYEYPFPLQGEDGFIHLVFAYRNRLGIKWTCFREQDVIGEKRKTS